MNNQVDTTNIINIAGDIRLKLHKFYFCNNDIIEAFKQILYESIPIFTLEYSEKDMTFIIKIKKTDIKQIRKDFSHTSAFYYPIINQALMRLFNTWPVFYMFSYDEFNRYASKFFCNVLSMPLLYNLTTESDNIIIISL